MARVNQNAVAGDRIVTVECSTDGGTAVEYSITSSNPAGVATVALSTGVVSLAVDAVELSGNSTVSLRCQESGGDGSATALLDIERVEENEFSPRFEEGDRVVNISEARDIETDSFVAQFTATDDDLGTFGAVSYSLHGSQSAGFAINSDTGVVTLTTSLDYDTNPVRLFQVRASNPATGTGEVRFAAVSLTVNVQDVNDEAPVFSESTYSAVVEETTADTPRPEPGFLVVSCTDVDSEDSSITYDAVSDPGPFLVDQITGSLSLTADLDYETTTSYSFTVACWDNGSPNLTSSAAVDVAVGPVNEGHPTLSSPSISVVYEGVPSGSEISQYTAVDPDDGPDGIITFTLATNGAQFLDINQTTGVLFVSAAEEIDFDTMNLTSPSATFYRYHFSITACDTHPPSSDCIKKNEVLYILGVNEDSPEFSASSYRVSHPENTPVGSSITTASCTDRDRGTGRFCGIAFDENVVSDVTNTFTVDSATGEIISLLPLDYETEMRYAFELVCFDSGDDGTCGGDGVKMARVSVDVMVEPVNDNRPYFTASLFEFNVSRTTPDDRRTVGVATAEDADQDEGGELDYMVESNGYFDITHEGNVQIFNSVSDYSQPSLSFNVSVSDGVSSDSALVVVHLTAGNLHSPEFIPGPRAVEVSQLSPVNTTIIFLTCQDRDTGVNGDLRYSITNGNTNDAFRVNELTGEVSVNNILLLSQNTTHENYILTISCEDGGVPVFSDLATVFISVYQDDSLPPMFSNHTVIAFVSEDVQLSHLVVTVEAVDLDSEQLRYTLEEQSVSGVFTIGISTGEVIVSALLDREVTSIYTAVVVATEERLAPGPERSDNISLTIHVRDVNDNSPSCEPSSPTTTINDTLPAGSAVLTLNCVDPDAAENGTISYSLANDFGVFAIDDHGVINLTRSLGEIDKDTLILSILLTDQGADPNRVTIQATIFITSETPAVDTPATRGVETPTTTDFFTTEIGIAVIVVLALVGVAISLLLCCVVVYCIIRYRRNKDPINAR